MLKKIFTLALIPLYSLASDPIDTSTQLLHHYQESLISEKTIHRYLQENKKDLSNLKDKFNAMKQNLEDDLYNFQTIILMKNDTALIPWIINLYQKQDLPPFRKCKVIESYNPKGLFGKVKITHKNYDKKILRIIIKQYLPPLLRPEAQLWVDDLPNHSKHRKHRDITAVDVLNLIEKSITRLNMAMIKLEKIQIINQEALDRNNDKIANLKKLLASHNSPL